jgi:malonyl-CoA/methylmalonyl-CoA synthetase
MAMSPSHQSASLSASSISLPASSASSIPNTDRVHLLPAHYGPNVFPNTPLFSKLLRHAHRGRLAIRDLRTGVNKTYAELLSDVLGLRGILEVSLDKDTLRQIEREQEVFLGVLAAGGYEYTVAILAVLALGAAAVPMSMWFRLSPTNSHQITTPQYLQC